MNFLVVGLVKGRRYHVDIKGEYSHAAGEHVAKEPDAMADVADVLGGVEGELEGDGIMRRNGVDVLGSVDAATRGLDIVNQERVVALVAYHVGEVEHLARHHGIVVAYGVGHGDVGGPHALCACGLHHCCHAYYDQRQEYS